MNVRVLALCRTCRAVPCVRYEAATDGSKIRSALQSNTQRPYAKGKLLSVCLSVCLSVASTWLGCSAEPPAVLIICPMLESGPVWEPHWHVRGCVCLIGLKPSALNPKQNEQAARWLLCHPPGPHVINTSNAAVMQGGGGWLLTRNRLYNPALFLVCCSH